MTVLKLEFYRMAQAAQILGTTRAVLRRLHREGVLVPTITEKGHRRYAHADLAKYLDDVNAWNDAISTHPEPNGINTPRTKPEEYKLKTCLCVDCEIIADFDQTCRDHRLSRSEQLTTLMAEYLASPIKPDLTKVLFEEKRANKANVCVMLPLNITDQFDKHCVAVGRSHALSHLMVNWIKEQHPE